MTASRSTFLIFDDSMLEFNQVYGEARPIPFYYLEVCIAYEEDEVPLDELVVGKVL